MLINDIYNIAKSIELSKQESIRSIILHGSGCLEEYVSGVPFEYLIPCVAACAVAKGVADNDKVIIYGAGKVAERILKDLKQLITIDEIWDMYSVKANICDVPVKKPYQPDITTSVIVALDDVSAKQAALDYLNSIECVSVYYYRELYDERLDIDKIVYIKKCISYTAFNVLNDLLDDYEVIDKDYPSVILSFLPKGLYQNNCKPIDRAILDRIKDSIEEILIIDEESEKNLDAYLSVFETEAVEDEFCLLYNIEVLLRKILFGSVKTKNRPIRMRGDYPYDRVAVIESLIAIFDAIYDTSYREALECAKKIRNISGNDIFACAVEAYYLCKCGFYEDGLEVSRIALHKGPDDFVANELFYHIAKECKKNDIYVDEPICELDLNEYFCWCGMNYAWCGGYDHEREAVAFAPCFRPSCAASPKDDFFTGEEWRDFRKSLVDGTFKYCQKSQCPNLVGGWLPRKDKCTDKTIRRILDGEYDTIPNMEEIHLSYDSHCNLKCPSCRTEFCTNTAEQNKNYDDFYFKFLQPYVKAAKHLCLQGCGEAMLSPHSRKILKSLDKKEYDELSVELRTNATSINRKNWESIGEGRKRIRHIAASIDSVTKESFEYIRFPAKWNVVLNNLEFIQQLRRNNEIDLFEFHVVIQKANLEELADIIKLACKLDVDVVTFSRMINWMGKSDKEYLDVNPFWIESDQHDKLKTIMEELLSIRQAIEKGQCSWLPDGKKIKINLPFVSDPDDSYDPIRYGRLKIR